MTNDEVGYFIKKDPHKNKLINEYSECYLTTD